MGCDAEDFAHSFYSTADLSEKQFLWVTGAITWTNDCLLSIGPSGINLVKFESKYKIFIEENESENVCEMVAILSRGRKVKEGQYDRQMITGGQLYNLVMVRLSEWQSFNLGFVWCLH